jgi:hypothetical protein
MLEALALDEEAAGQVRLHSANGPSVMIVLPWRTATRLTSDGSARDISRPTCRDRVRSFDLPTRGARRAPKGGGNDA